jgi:two-component system KDP operon response regulator KdpE
MTARILIVEDDRRWATVVAQALRERLDAETRVAAGGREAVRTARAWQPDLILLDLGLADGHDGYAVCREIREFSKAGIIMLTARERESEKLMGFSAGADDYVTKPPALGELAARCQALLRRAAPSEAAPGPQVVRAGDLTIDVGARRVTRDGADLRLSRTELKLLLALARRAGRPVPVEDLLAEVWGPEYRNARSYVEVYVSRLRARVEPDRQHPSVVVTVPPLGYMLRGE